MDITLNKLLTLGTHANRLLFTPSPPANILVLWYETDTQDTFAWDGAAWVGVAAGVPIDLATQVTGDLPFANLTQGTARSVLGVTGNATADVASIQAGTDNQVLRRSGVAVAFGQVNLASANAVTGVLPIANFTTGAPTGSKFVRDDGVLAVPSGTTVTGAIGVTIDGGGSTITTGVKAYVSIPYTCTITKVRLLSVDATPTSGSIVVDIWKDTYANYPPTVADTITAAAKPTITTATKSEDATLTGWTTSITAGDVLGFNVDSVTSLTKVLLTLTTTR